MARISGSSSKRRILALVTSIRALSLSQVPTPILGLVQNLGQRYSQGEASTPTRGLGVFNVSAPTAKVGAAKGETPPVALTQFFGGKKGFEDSALKLRRYAWAIVGNRDFQVLVYRLHSHRHPLFSRVVFIEG